MSKVWQWKIFEFIKDPNGTLSHTKFWSNVGYAAITYAFIDTSSSRGASPELILAYAAAIGVYRLGNKYIDLQGAKNDSTNATTEGS